VRALRIPALALAASLAALASAQNIAYNNFGPGDSYDDTGDSQIGSGGIFSWAMEFTSATSGPLDSIAFAFSSWNSYKIALCQDTGGNGPGTQLQSWVSSGNDNGLSYVYGNGSTSLVAGQSYWVTVEPPSDGGAYPYGKWFWSNDTYDPVDYSGMYVPPHEWYPVDGARSSAFRVETVPEPASLAGLAFAAGALLIRRRRHT